MTLQHDSQALKLSYIARCLITDLQPLYAEECIGQKLNEERALQLILDAFEQASSVLTCPTDFIPEQCPHCKQYYPSPAACYHTNEECVDRDILREHFVLP